MLTVFHEYRHLVDTMKKTIWSAEISANAD